MTSVSTDRQDSVVDSDEVPLIENDTPQLTTKWIRKNHWVINFVFMLNFLAYNGLGNLQSSLHRSGGLGTVGQSVVYFSVIFSALFLPRPFIARFGQKRTIVLGIIGYMTWMAANGYATWWTLLPTSALVGLSASPLWVSCNSYITKIATLQAELQGDKKDVMVTRFFGVFMAIFSISNIASSLTSSLVLQSTLKNESHVAPDVTQYCGANDCPWKNATNGTNTNLQPVNPTIVWILVGTYLALASLGLLLAVFCLDPLPDHLQDKTFAESPCAKSLELFSATIRMTCHPVMLVLIPFRLSGSLFFEFVSAEWPASYIMCTLGILWVGYISAPAGVLQSVLNYAGSRLNKFTGRVPIMLVAQLSQVAVLLLWLLWQPQAGHLYMFFVVSCLIGTFQGLQGPQVNGLLSVSVKDNVDAVFAFMQLCGSVGNTISFAYSDYICNTVKVYLMIGLWALGTIGYLLAEFLAYRNREKMDTETVHRVNDGECDSCDAA